VALWTSEFDHQTGHVGQVFSVTTEERKGKKQKKRNMLRMRVCCILDEAPLRARLHKKTKPDTDGLQALLVLPHQQMGITSWDVTPELQRRGRTIARIRHW